MCYVPVGEKQIFSFIFELTCDQIFYLMASAGPYSIIHNTFQSLLIIQHIGFVDSTHSVHYRKWPKATQLPIFE